MTAHAKVGGAFKDVETIHCKVGGSWKEVTEGYSKIAGVWKQFYSANQALTYEFIDSFNNTGGGPTYTFSNIDIGQTGLVVVSVGSEGSNDLQSVTIGGITASTAGDTVEFGNMSQGLFYAEVTASSTVDIVVTFDGTMFRMALGVWRINNYVSTSPRFTYADEGNDATRSITTDSLLENSVIIAGVSEGNAALFSWSGVSEDYDTTTSENLTTLSGASTQVSSSGAVTVSSTFSGSPNASALTVAVWDETPPPPPLSVEYLVIAGGGGGGAQYAGGGGAGGYRSSVSGESSGGGASAETALTLTLSTNYTVTVGAGGASTNSNTVAAGNGSNSVFSTITSIGGGRGGNAGGAISAPLTVGQDGGSGGGVGNEDRGGLAGSGTTGQGFDGGFGIGAGGGGGGAGGAGSAPVSGGTNRPGGVGVSSSITGSSVTRAVGGTARRDPSPANNGTQNTGDGGEGANNYYPSGAGGSGVVILRYPSGYSITLTGVSGTTTTVGANKVTTITSGSGTVSWS